MSASARPPQKARLPFAAGVGAILVALGAQAALAPDAFAQTGSEEAGAEQAGAEQAGSGPAGSGQDDTAGIATSYGPRPAYLIDRLPEGSLKDELRACQGQTPEPTRFSIFHRGAPLQFPEHTVESARAGARQGAGLMECDVTFTQDKALVCRHAQDDLQRTTNILTTDLAAQCSQPFTPARDGEEASATCLSSDVTLEQFKTLQAKMDAFDTTATTTEEALGGVAPWRTTLYSDDATLMTHAESIELFDELGGDFVPELKEAVVEMPFDGFSQNDYAQKLIDEYKDAGIEASRVWPQSFVFEHVAYWLENEPEFAEQAVYLVQWTDGFDEQDPSTWQEDFQSLADRGLNYLAPSINMLVTVDDGEIVASAYAKAARAAGLDLVAWTLERSGPLTDGGGWYYQSVADEIDGAEDYLRVLDTLAQDVGVTGVFSDWPATVTYYANCKGL